MAEIDKPLLQNRTKIEQTNNKQVHYVQYSIIFQNGSGQETVKFFNVSSIQMSGRVTICIPDKSGTIGIRLPALQLPETSSYCTFTDPLAEWS